jgi:phosphatidylserine/phosphatidylglycerophosphate/cardiolipin synthase-like enzyme
MPMITKAFAFANNEIAYLAWDVDVRIPGCLGFHIVREYLDDHDNLISERPLAAYVAFKGQSNPDWTPQNTSVWPVQKFNWRDLTLRRKRDEAKLRPLEERLRYRIQAVGRFTPSLDEVVTVPETHWDNQQKLRILSTYKGTPVRLSYLTQPSYTNVIEATYLRRPFISTFTNGILSTQFLVRVLEDDGKIEDGELVKHLKTPDDWLRNYLAADVLPVIHAFFKQEGGRFHAALYELEDEELVTLLCDNAERLDLILSDAGGPDEQMVGGVKTKIYDTRNGPAREKLHALAERDGTGFSMQNRMFSGSGHIGHNKFVVYVDGDGIARSVITGSTNWTWSGIAGQSNNCIRIDDDRIADAYLEYWRRLQSDRQVEPNPISAPATGANQGDELKKGNRTKFDSDLVGGGHAEVWFSPNMPGKQQPPGKTVKTSPSPPPDMERLFSLIRKAERAIFFLVFLPSRGGQNSIVSEAINFGLKDTSLEVVGAISDQQAMWGFEASSKTADGKKIPAWSPYTFQSGGVSVVRATELTDRKITGELGDFKLQETLTTGKAIIHDKILVIDPHDPKNCVVAFGSHNMGYRASYANDENLVIVQGHRGLAEAYTAHVLDVYDHYRFRAVEAELSAKKSGETSADQESKRWDGFLSTDDKWQDSAGRRLSRYFTSSAT